MQSDASDIAISVKKLGKTYRLFSHPGDRIKQFFSFGMKQYHREFTALNDVSFEIKRGETVGIIGRNGSGKSTLLQLICGILKPTSGTIQVNGRISALLELGAGFNPEFTGRENVYFQGALMGFTQEQMETRFDEIEAFADIGEFIDQPVRVYSSGMFVRLAFAVAVHLEPDILIVDEALAVGDIAFQAKCMLHLSALRQRGVSIVLVTHNLEQAAHFCSRIMVLQQGLLRIDDTVQPALQKYLSFRPGLEISNSNAPPGSLLDRLEGRSAYRKNEVRWGDRSVTITDACVIQDEVVDPDTIQPGIPCEIRFWCQFHTDIENPIFGLAIKSATGGLVFTANSQLLIPSAGRPNQKANKTVCVKFFLTPILEAGEYWVSLGVISETEIGALPHDRRYDCLLLRMAASTSGCVLPSCLIQSTDICTQAN